MMLADLVEDAVAQVVLDVVQEALWLLDEGVPACEVTVWASRTVDAFKPRLVALLR